MQANEVLNKHKDIFRDFFGGTMETSCMVWGLEVPSAWYSIIDELCTAWESFSWTRGKTKKPQLVADQVKEKYGGLRFYYHLEFEGIFDDETAKWYEHIMDGMVSYAESRIESREAGIKKLEALLEKEEKNDG